MVPQGQSIAKLCKEYNITEAKLNELTRWVNSPSVDKDRTQVVLSEDGEESVKMMVRLVGTLPLGDDSPLNFPHLLYRPSG
jgi:hypothetical protein